MTASTTERTLPGRRSSARASTRRAGGRGLTVVMWLAGLYFLFPLYWLVVAATKSPTDLFATFGLWFGRDFDLWANLVQVFTIRGGIYLHWALNSLIYAVVSAAGATFMATLAGYAFAKYEFRGSRFLFSSVLGAIMIPATALAIPTYLLFSGANLTNTPLAVILPSMVSPFGLYLMRVYAEEAVPDSLIEAGRVDGASEARIFWQLASRMLGPGIVTVFLFSLVATWNNYFLPLIMLNTSAYYPLTVGLAQLQAASAAGGGAQVAFTTVITGSLVSIVPLVIAFLVLQRYWQSGLSAGSIKE